MFFLFLCFPQKPPFYDLFLLVASHSGVKLEKVVDGVHKPNFLTKKTLFELNLPKNRILLELYQQCDADEHDWHSANVSKGKILGWVWGTLAPLMATPLTLLHPSFSESTH